MTGYNYRYHIPEPEPEDKLLPRVLAYENLVSGAHTKAVERAVEEREFWELDQMMVIRAWGWRYNLTSLESIRSKPLPKVRPTRLRGLRAPEAG